MFNSVALNVVIGLVFIYLLYSLLASIIQEFISTHIGLRARILKKGIRRMLDDGDSTNQLSTTFYGHPLVKYLGEGKIHSKPSYLSGRNFSKIVIDLLRGEHANPGHDFRPMIQQALDEEQTQWMKKTPINPETLSFIRSMWADSQGDVDKFRAMLEQWFDDTMERASGWYKKRIQLILFLIGFSLAVIFNVDTITIAQKLSRDPRLAEQLADNASDYIKNHQALSAQLKKNGSVDSVKLASNTDWFETARELMNSADAMVKNDIENVNQVVGLGWHCQCEKISTDEARTNKTSSDRTSTDKTSTDKARRDGICIDKNFHWWSPIGWAITALAISLGAPFWFDLLNKLMKMRGAGKAAGNDTEKPEVQNRLAVINPKG